MPQAKYLLHHKRPYIALGVLLASLWLGLAWPHPSLAQDTGQTLVVGAGHEYQTIDTALLAAQDGDTIEVRGGEYLAPVVIEKSVRLIGIDNPIIDGHGEGTLIFIHAPDVLLKGFTIRNSGTVQHHEDAAVDITAPRVIIEDNHIENVLYGIFFASAPDGIARHNTIYGIGDDPALRGDSIRVWYSNNVQILDNHVEHTRDTLVWYSDNLVVTDNTFINNRYGLHFMYNDGAHIEHNVFENNSVGAFLMYSIDPIIKNNIFAYNRGPSGYGLAMKDMDNVIAEDNFFVGNRAGLYLDNSPALYDNYNHFTGNVFAYNDVGTTTLPAVERNIFTGNSYLDNTQQISMRGREVVSRNIWSYEGVGNYWSDYAGYDKNDDGIGEAPYQSDKLFESLMDEYPVIQLFTYSPAVQAIEFTGSAFPVLRPQPKLVDDAPLMDYEFPAYLEANNSELSPTLLLSSLALFGVALAITVSVWLGFTRQKKKTLATTAHQRDNLAEQSRGKTMITVENLSKRYGKQQVLDTISFKVEAGEAVALWGTNGAGKTTTLQCLLGIIPFNGQIMVNEINVRKDGKAARSAIGYVPQEAIFYDLSVQQTVRFYARLKKVDLGEIEQVLTRVDLLDHAQKPVRALSGGMKQRLALAISLLGDPPILILDEPTANLDTQSRYDFLQLVQTLNHDGKTIIFSTHRLDEVMALATRAIVLREGRVYADCHPSLLAEQLELQQWLRVWIPQPQWPQAMALLKTQGFASTPNGRAVYVNISGTSKMTPLRLLEAAQISVEDFDVVDGHAIPNQETDE